MNPFPALTVPHPFIFLSSLSNTDLVALSANLGKISLTKETARSIITFLPKLPIALPNVLP